MSAITVDTSKMQSAGSNVLAEVQGNNLVLVINLNAKTEPSSTGKMDIVASSQGWTSFPDNWKGNVMVGKRR